MQMPTSVKLFTVLFIRVKCYFASLPRLAFFSFFFSHSVFAFSTAESISDKQRSTILAAQQKIENKDYKEALSLSAEILIDNPNQYEAQFIRAQSLSQLGKTDEAIKLYRLILKSNQTSGRTTPEVYNNLATLYAQQGKLDEARQTLEQGIATDIQYKTLYDNLSAIYVEMARGAYSKALKLGVQAKAVQLKDLNVALLTERPSPRTLASQTTTSTTPTISFENTKAVNETNIETASKAKQDTKPEGIVESTPKLTQVAAVDKTVKQKPKAPAAKKQLSVKKAAVVKKPVEVNKEEVITALQGWAAAWSAQAVDLYLSFYGKDFKPVKLSKKVWAVQRRIRLKKPRWVNVRLDDFKVKAQSNNFAVVQLVQDYRADNYRDKTRKQFRMKRTVDGWRILSEKSLAVLR